MCIVFTCGEHEFASDLKGYEGVVCQCHNCGNYTATVKKRWNWFTLCFVPVLPLSFHSYEDIVCPICGFAQPLQNRQDVLAQSRGIPTNEPHANELQAQVPPTNYGVGGQVPGAKVNENMVYR